MSGVFKQSGWSPVCLKEHWRGVERGSSPTRRPSTALTTGVSFNLLGSSLFCCSTWSPGQSTLYSVFVKLLVVNSALGRWDAGVHCTSLHRRLYTGCTTRPGAYVGILAAQCLQLQQSPKLPLVKSSTQHHTGIICAEFPAADMHLRLCPWFCQLQGLTGWVFTVIEVTVSNLKFRWCSHAGILMMKRGPGTPVEN